MFVRTTTIALVSLLFFPLQQARADDWHSGIREDFRALQQSRSAVVGASARLYVERRELAEARARLRQDWRDGNFAAIRRDERRVREEAADVREAEARLNADRAKLNREARELRDDWRGHRRHHGS